MVILQMNLKSQISVLKQPEENVEALNGLIGWFNQSSLELIQEYRRLEPQPLSRRVKPRVLLLPGRKI